MKIHEYNEMMSYLTRPAVNRTGFNQGTKKVASLMDEYLGDQKEYQRAVDEGFQGTYEEFLRMRSMRETSARGGVIGEGGMFQGQDMGYRTGFNRVEHAKYKKITKLTPANLANFKYPKDHKYKVQVPTRTDLGPGSLQTISAKTKKELKEKVDNSPNTSKDRLKIFKKSDLPEGAVSHDATRYKMRTGEYTGKGRNKSQIFSLHYKGNPDGFVRYFTSPGKRLFDSIEEVKAGKRKNSQDMSRPLKIKTQRIAENIVKNTYEIPGTEEIYEKFKPFIGKDKITIAGEGVDTLEEAQKFVDDYFKKNPKIIRVRDPKKDWASKDKRLTALAETEPTKAKGTATHNFHHIRQIAGGVPLTSDDVLIIDQRINSSLGTKYDKPLNAIADAIRKNNRLALEAMNAQEESLALEYMKRSDDLNAQAEKLVNSAIDKLPKKYKGYVGFNQFTLPRNEYGFPISNEPMIIKKVGGVPVSKDAIDLTDLNLKQEAEFRKIVRQQAEAGKTGPIREIRKILINNGASKDAATKVTDAIQSMNNKFGSGMDPMDVARWAKAELGVIAEVGSKYGGKVFRNLAAIDLPINQVLFAKYVTDFAEDSPLWTTIPMAFTDEVSKFYNLYDKSGGKIKNFIKLAARSGVSAKLAQTVFPLISKAGKIGSTLAYPFLHTAAGLYKESKLRDATRRAAADFKMSPQKMMELRNIGIKKDAFSRFQDDDYVPTQEDYELASENIKKQKDKFMLGARKLGSFVGLADDPYAQKEEDIVTVPEHLKEDWGKPQLLRNLEGNMNQGGRAGFDGGGSPLQRLRQEIVDSMRPYAPGDVTEDQLQLIVKDITLDMTAEQAQASAKSNFIKLFGMASGGRVGFNGGGRGRPKGSLGKSTKMSDKQQSDLLDPDFDDLSLEEWLRIKKLLESKEFTYNQGGRVGFGKGSPKSPGRRAFLKGITALAALPLVGRYFKLGKVLERASTYTGPAIEKIKGMPEWFPGLVKKLWNEGEDVTKQMATVERQIVKRGTLEGGDDVDLIYYADTGDVSIQVVPKKGKIGTESGAYNKEYSLDYRKGIGDESTKGTPPDEFGVMESKPIRTSRDDIELDWDEANVDDAMSDLTELEAFSKNKSVKNIHKKKGTKKKDVAPDVDIFDFFPEDY